VTKNGPDSGIFSKTQAEKEEEKKKKKKKKKKRAKATVVIEHGDLIKDEFWEDRAWLLSGRANYM